MHVIRELLYLLSLSVFLDGALSESCGSHTACADCIRDASVCVWCASNAYVGENRCLSKDANFTTCPDNLENPDNEKTIEKQYNSDFSSVPGHVCQIKPQKYRLKLRPGKPLPFNFSLQIVQDYPVDVYFLLDASNTMNVTKEAAVAQSKNIFETLKSYTNDVYLGMGTFVDKNTLPYSRLIHDHKAYSFKNALKLNPDYKKFQEIMKNTKFGSNRDPPEGGLDALAQAIVCKDEIGWRSQSRKIIIFLTDGPYHAAGDGRSGGIFQPYDGKCYTVNGTYANELTMDYPSVSMINKLVKENDVIIIFAIHPKSIDKYASITAAISGAQKNTLDNKDDKNIVKILRDIYEKLTKKIKLKINKKSGQRNNFKITLKPDCTKKRSTDACNVSPNKIYNFTGTLTLPEYIGSDHGVVDIGIEGISEKLTLDIDIINECGCKREAKRSKHCNDEIRECGVCKCEEPKYGLNCACVRNMATKIDDTKACIMSGTTVDCNGQGKCTCGKCHCKPGYEGQYCEYNLMLCPRDSNGELCSGIKQGDCLYDKKCKCKTGWSGPVCECSDDDSLCKAYNGKVCNDRGSCVCESCECNDPASWDGRTEKDQYCVLSAGEGTHERQCKLLADCLICVLKEHDNCPSLCSSSNYVLVDTLDTNTTDAAETKLWSFCSNVRVDVGCYGNFAYKYDTEKYGIYLKIQKNYNCAESYFIYGGILLVTLILVGVGTLVGWKLLTDARDRREYLRFVKNAEADAISENPLYKPAAVSFKNPTFKRSFT